MKPPTIVLALLSSSCHSIPDGAQAATPQRPTVSSDTATTAPGSIELEVGGALLDGGSYSVPLALKYGTSEATEVFAGWVPYVRVDSPGFDANGSGDVSLGARHRFRDESDEAPSLAAQAIIKLPTADEDRALGTGEPDLLLAGIATRSVDALTLTGFVQLDLLGDPDGGVLVGQSVAIAAARPVLDRVGVFGEVAGLFVPELDSEQLFTSFGLNYSPFRFLVCDVGVIVGLNDAAPDFGVVFGFTRNLGRTTNRWNR